MVAARAGGMVEIIEPGYNGLLVQPGSAGELVAAVSHLLADETLRRLMGLNGCKRMLERYTWDAIGSDLLRAYQLNPAKV